MVMPIKSSLQRHHALQSGRYVLMFQRNLLSPMCEQMNKPCMKKTM
jgi:hypothetical protein